MLRTLVILLISIPALPAHAQITWQKVNGPNETMNALAATPAGDLFLGSNNYGILKSGDAGVTWVSENQGMTDILIRNVEASSNNEVFAGTGSNGIYKYSAGSWVAANTGLPSNNLLTSGFARGLSGDMYMFTTADGMYKWDGAAWTSIRYNLPSLIRALAVDQSGVLYAGCFNSGVYKFNGVDTWTSIGSMPNSFVTRMAINSSGMLFAACNSNNIYRIPVSGGSWTSINSGLPALNTTVMGIDAGDNVFLGFNTGGYATVYRSANNGASWSVVSGGLYTSQFNGFAATANGDSYLAGSGVFKSTTGGTSWQDMNPGLDARKSIKSFSAAPDGTLFVGTQLSGVWRSTDNGTTWLQKNVGITTPYTDQITTTASGVVLYSSYIPGSTTTGVIFRSTNNGDTWTQVASNGTDHYDKIKQHHADTVWAAGRFGGPVLSYSVNNGATWVNHPIASFSAIWDVEFNPGSTIFLGSESEGVTRSTNGGNTWTEGVGGSVAWYGNVIEVELDHNGYLFAGTDWYNNIMWFSPPGSNGDAWTKFLDPDLNGVNDVYDLVFDVNNNAYLATGNTAYKDPVYMAANSAWTANTDWVSVSTGLPSIAPALEFGFDPSGYMYTVFFMTGQEGGLYRTTTPINIPLPIELTSFIGHHRNDRNELAWSTASEHQNWKFEVEKSMDGVQFHQIGVVPGHGNTDNANDYAFSDVGVSTGINYYRLRQVDQDGKGTYSKIISLRADQPAFTVWPNPATDVLSLTNDPGVFDIINAWGQKMNCSSVGPNQISVRNLPDGVYVVRTKDSVVKFLVKH